VIGADVVRRSRASASAACRVLLLASMATTPTLVSTKAKSEKSKP
jgi:hypothetical protein